MVTRSATHATADPVAEVSLLITALEELLFSFLMLMFEAVAFCKDLVAYDDGQIW